MGAKKQELKLSEYQFQGPEPSRPSNRENSQNSIGRGGAGSSRCASRGTTNRVIKHNSNHLFRFSQQGSSIRKEKERAVRSISNNYNYPNPRRSNIDISELESAPARVSMP
jgi:hypothetical protein